MPPSRLNAADTDTDADADAGVAVDGAERRPLLATAAPDKGMTGPPRPRRADAVPLTPAMWRAERPLARYWRCMKLCAWLSLQLGLVYFFEYVVSSGCAGKVLRCVGRAVLCTGHSTLRLARLSGRRHRRSDEQHSTDFWYANIYAILAFSYQLGVFVSRSSLQLIKIRHVEILTVLQAANMVLWIVDDQYKFLPVGALVPLMVFVGLLGGASYVNVFYLLLIDPRIPEQVRDAQCAHCSVRHSAGPLSTALWRRIASCALTWSRS